MNLTAELPPLIAAMLAVGHDVRRVIFPLGTWDTAPRTVNIAGRRIGLSGYAAQDPQTIRLVTSPGWDYVNLVVIPPGTDALSARRAMDIAGHNGDRRGPAEVLIFAVHRPIPSAASCTDELSLTSWETEGGGIVPSSGS